MERERESRNPIRARQLCSGDVGFVTWRSSSSPASYSQIRIIVSVNSRSSIVPIIRIFTLGNGSDAGAASTLAVEKVEFAFKLHHAPLILFCPLFTEL